MALAKKPGIKKLWKIFYDTQKAKDEMLKAGAKSQRALKMRRDNKTLVLCHPSGGRKVGTVQIYPW